MMQLCISRILKVIETEAKPNVHRKRAREDQPLLFLFCFFFFCGCNALARDEIHR